MQPILEAFTSHEAKLMDLEGREGTCQIDAFALAICSVSGKKKLANKYANGASHLG